MLTLSPVTAVSNSIFFVVCLEDVDAVLKGQSCHIVNVNVHNSVTIHLESKIISEVLATSCILPVG